MKENNTKLFGELENWPPKNEMAELLISCGISVVVGNYSIRLQNFNHFIIQEYDFNGSTPCIDADAETKEQMLKEANLVSECFSKARLKHRFEIYDDNDLLAGYYHYQWAKDRN